MSCRGFEAVCTNGEARKYFRDKGLSYHDITEGDILSLLRAFLRWCDDLAAAKEAV